jgi:uncharacterized protein YecE (DUF72 family)
MDRNGVQIRIGVGGWEHEVMDRVFYGRDDLSQCQKLAVFSETFDHVEIRSTFWDEALGASDAEGWMRAVEVNPGFRFTVKLHREFTHRRKTPPGLRDRVRGILQALATGGRLTGLLAQFPFSFTNTSTNRYWLIKVAELFRGFPFFADFRHISWCQPPGIQLLREQAITPVNPDLPRFGQMMPFHTGYTGPAVYIRLHGRNEKGWLRNALDARYDYLYNARELMELRRRVDYLPAQSREVTIVFNNTTSGNALANALQLRSSFLGNRPVEVPFPLLKVFPGLHEIAVDGEVNPGLFGGPGVRAAG